ncbi:uncharacterized protein LOC127530283 [Acanthochromis polyacanthus]|uniref:uncharacterized protein LOC127530283 n=1 Tax=Acanthochromis polyacanthus TaxID=80966 RepID=UPI00223455BB|nr:uncharacterized protein LOC127530283 [Acanthochromis polyacanthus]
MAESIAGLPGSVQALLCSAAAGFVFGEAASFAAEPALTADGVLLSAATLAAGRTGSTGVTVVSACLVFTSALLSLGSGFLLAAVTMKLLGTAGVRLPWLPELLTGASVVLGAVVTGALAGLLPPWIYIGAQAALVLLVYSYSNISDMTTALLIIFTTLFLSVAYGRMGLIFGLLLMVLTTAVLLVLRRTFTKRPTRRPAAKGGCKLLERIVFYAVFVGILGFFVGLGAGQAGDGSEPEVVLMLHSVLWVAFLSAGLLGAGLGTVAMVSLGPAAALKVSVGAAVLVSAALRLVLLWSSSLEARSCTGAALGAAAAAGVSLGAASVASKLAFGSRNSTLAALGSVAAGVVVAMKVVALKATPLTSELITVSLVAAGAFVLGAPKSPFNTQVNLQQGLLTGTELIKGIGMETVTAAAAPIGAGALGAAALGTAALGRLGTLGVVVAIVLALGSALSGMIGKSPATTQEHTD